MRVCQQQQSLVKFSDSRHISGTGEAMHFKFHIQVYHSEFLLMRDRLPLNGVCSESYDFFKFW